MKLIWSQLKSRVFAPMLIFALVSSAMAGEFRITGISQWDGEEWPSSDRQHTSFRIEIQNGRLQSEGPFTGVWEVREVYLDMRALLGDVVQTIASKNPKYEDEDAVWDALHIQILDSGQLSGGWYVDKWVDIDYQTPEHRIVVIRNVGGIKFLDYSPWENAYNNPNRSTMLLQISLTDLLDFDGNNRVDPGEMIYWDGESMAGYIDGDGWWGEGNDPHSGIVLIEGLGAWARPIPRLSLGGPRHLSNELTVTEAGASFRFPTENPARWNWLYMIQRSNDLVEWENVEAIAGTGNWVERNFPREEGSEFWRVKVTNRGAYQPYLLRPVSAYLNHTIGLTPTLRWQGGDAAAEYRVYLGTSSDLQESDLLGSTAAQEFAVDTLDYENTYWWRVDAVFSDGMVFPGATTRIITRPHPFQLSRQTYLYDHTARELTIQLNATEDWELIGIPDWIDIQPTAGTGSVSLAVVMSENQTSEERTVEVTLQGPTASRILTFGQFEGVPNRQVFLEEDWTSMEIDPIKWTVTAGSFNILSGYELFSPGDAGGRMETAQAFPLQPGLEIKVRKRLAESGAFWNLFLVDADTEETLGPLIRIGDMGWGYNESFVMGPTGPVLHQMTSLWRNYRIRFLSDGSVAYLDGEEIMHRTPSGWIDYSGERSVKWVMEAGGNRSYWARGGPVDISFPGD